VRAVRSLIYFFEAAIFTLFQKFLLDLLVFVAFESILHFKMVFQNFVSMILNSSGRNAFQYFLVTNDIFSVTASLRLL
jgi:hypothetical protein